MPPPSTTEDEPDDENNMRRMAWSHTHTHTELRFKFEQPVDSRVVCFCCAQFGCIRNERERERATSERGKREWKRRKVNKPSNINLKFFLLLLFTAFATKCFPFDGPFRSFARFRPCALKICDFLYSPFYHHRTTSDQSNSTQSIKLIERVSLSAPCSFVLSLFPSHPSSQTPWSAKRKPIVKQLFAVWVCWMAPIIQTRRRWQKIATTKLERHRVHCVLTPTHWIKW